MSWLSSGLRKIKKIPGVKLAGRITGKSIQIMAPIAGGALFGPAGAAAGSAYGNFMNNVLSNKRAVLSGKNLKGYATNAAIAGATAGIGNKIGLDKVAGGVIRKLPSGGVNLPAGGPQVSITPAQGARGAFGGFGTASTLPAAGTAATGAARGFGGNLAEGVKRALGGLSATDVIKGAATGYDIYNQERDRSFNRKRLQRGDEIFEEDRRADADWYNSLAPFRQAGQEGLLKPWTPIDYGAIFNAAPPVVRKITTPEYATLNPARRPQR